jgi:DNA-binding NarL/FixJ family response regulator
MIAIERQPRESGRLRAARVAVVDARQLIAEALASVVADEPSFDVVAVASGAVKAAAVAEARPDIVLVGVAGPAQAALELVDALCGLLPDVQIVLMADVLSREMVGAVLERSLAGLLLTDHPAQDLTSSLSLIAQGRSVMPTGWQSVLGAEPTGPLDALSDRQMEVLRLLAEGCSYEEIGGRLFISVNTVKFHMRSIFERLGVRNRMAAVRILTDAASG